jgi:hypothetical protein
LYIQGSSDLENSYNANLPATYDYLKPNGFRFVIKDLPNVAYTCQEVTLPTLGIGFVQVGYTSIDIKIPDHKPEFGDLSLNFIVSENMQNYKELFNWLIGLTQYDPEIYNSFMNKRLNRFPGATKENKYSELVKYSDASLFILNSSNLPKIEVKFKQLFPITLSPLSFNTTVDNIQYLVCGATFKYLTFEVVTQ